ncbi:MFS transporter [Catenulispora sp. NL8]|uniref:MFS transporter n=1 Tax=Catenulispora pinistramenti TaxID=2705254 RepID=A0ABS5KQ41_9ACTN|nr:MFS transporter [Catenulispora pinistramenti]MBS2548159.1 MFS transporter [Catenulispora pinistramenti]
MNDTAPEGELRFRDSLRHLPPRVWIVSAGNLVNRAGNFLPIFIVLYLASKHRSAGAAGLVLGAAGIGNVLGATLGGHLADRIGRRWTMTVSALLTAGLTALVPLVGNLALLVGLVGLTGVASQLYRPAAAALLVDGMDHQQRLAASGVFRFGMNVGASIGGVLGGLLASRSFAWLFYSNAMASLAFGILTAILVRDAPRPAAAVCAADGDTGADGDADADAGSGSGAEHTAADPTYRTALRDRHLRRFLAMTFVAEFVYVQSTVGLPLHVTSVGLSAESFGLLIGLNGLLVLICELPLTGAVSRRRPEYVLFLGNLLTGAGLALTVFADSMFWLAATVVLWTAGEMLYASMAAAHLGGLSPPHLVGRYQGLYAAAITAGTGLGPLIGGLVYTSSTKVFWLLVGAAGLWSAQLCLPPRRRADRQGAGGTGPDHHPEEGREAQPIRISNQ